MKLEDMLYIQKSVNMLIGNIRYYEYEKMSDGLINPSAISINMVVKHFEDMIRYLDDIQNNIDEIFQSEKLHNIDKCIEKIKPFSKEGLQKRIDAASNKNKIN